MSGSNEPKRRGRSFSILIVVVVAVVIYSIAIQVTRIDLAEPLEPQRQENLVGLIRELTHPDFLSYENITRSTNLSFFMPCPEQVRGTQVSLENRLVTLSPNCAETTQDILLIIGEGFAPNTQGIVRWYPLNSLTTRQLTTFLTDSNGRFEETFTMPDIRESEEAQRFEVVERIDQRATGLSDTTTLTVTKIIETILIALMASTLGTILAIPISFLGARNLMSNVGSPLAAISAGIIAVPIGGGTAYLITRLIIDQITALTDNLLIELLLAIILFAGIGLLLRSIRLQIEKANVEDSSRSTFLLMIVGLILFTIIALGFLGDIGITAGDWLKINLHVVEFLGVDLFGFIGDFVLVLSEITVVFLPIFLGVLGALILASYASTYGQEAVLHLENRPARILTAVLAFFGSFITIYAILYFINWICLFEVCNQFEQEPTATLIIFSAIVGIAVTIVALLIPAKKLLPVGMITYMGTRTVLNVLRAIEPVILGFVLVVWVGLGPFAGVLALMLHSVADLGKLFSEQVENIDEGPVEAVTATGAGKLQTIVYSVIPQVVPHYIAFIFYRWDINVRMSTIIGLVGGGGIGLVLFRNTNLLRYRQAAVMIIAIALVVTILDNASSRIRKRII